MDVREFRSSLPLLIYRHNIRVIPCTLEVGDYILSPRICVERKSISDLISSLKGGRLYTQCEAMSLHYDIPVLLIEFDQNRSFSLKSNQLVRNDISGNDISSQLTLLCIHFPKLSIIWSSSPFNAAVIFQDIKVDTLYDNIYIFLNRKLKKNLILK